MILNLSPHPMRIYPPNCPDRITRGSVEPLVTIWPASKTPYRAGETIVGDPLVIDDIPVVEFQFGSGDPPLPDPVAGTWLLVSRPVAMVNPDRTDLLVVYREVRDMDGSTLGCRALARPIKGLTP